LFFTCPQATVANGWPPEWRRRPWRPTSALGAAGKKGASLTSGPKRGKGCNFKKKRCSQAPKMTKFLQDKDKITNSILHQQSLKHIFYSIRKINKTVVFRVSKNFMPRISCHKIKKKYSKFINLSLVFI